MSNSESPTSPPTSKISRGSGFIADATMIGGVCVGSYETGSEVMRQPGAARASETSAKASSDLRANACTPDKRPDDEPSARLAPDSPVRRRAHEASQSERRGDTRPGCIGEGS